MTEDFAILDFALVAVRPLAVAEGLERARQGGSTATLDVDSAQPKKGLLGRIFGGGKSAASEPVKVTLPPLCVQPAETLSDEPVSRMVLTDMGFGSEEDPIRLSAPVGAGGLTLLEYRDRGAPGRSALLEQLSSALPGTEIFSFRYSGPRHPGAEYSFAVYLNGSLARLRACSSQQGTADDADWDGFLEGKDHDLEKTLTGPSERDPAAIMTPQIQAGLLRGLGIEPENLFEGISKRQEVLVLSMAPGGTPLNEAIEAASTSSGAFPPRAEAPVVAGDGPWEDEVTELLVQAVEDALPEDEQVPWLDALTEQLEGGDIEGALQAAQALIEKGNRPTPERTKAAERLAALFNARG